MMPPACAPVRHRLADKHKERVPRGILRAAAGPSFLVDTAPRYQITPNPLSMITKINTGVTYLMNT